MTVKIENNLEAELHDVFNVTQVTRDTPIEETVGADLVTMEPDQSSQAHRHNLSETVLFFTEGKAIVYVNHEPIEVIAGDRLLVRPAEFHSVDTGPDDGCAFLSIQSPPILSKATGFKDFETEAEAKEKEKLACTS